MNARCDRCGGAGRVEVVTPKGGLVLCGSHFAQHGPALRRFVLVPVAGVHNVNTPAAVAS